MPSKPASGLSAQAETGREVGGVMSSVGRRPRVSITGWLRVGLALEWSWLAAGTVRSPARAVSP